MGAGAGAGEEGTAARFEEEENALTVAVIREHTYLSKTH